jgi:hypothetical protein
MCSAALCLAWDASFITQNISSGPSARYMRTRAPHMQRSAPWRAEPLSARIASAAIAPPTLISVADQRSHAAETETTCLSDVMTDSLTRIAGRPVAGSRVGMNCIWCHSSALCDRELSLRVMAGGCLLLSLAAPASVGFAPPSGHEGFCEEKKLSIMRAREGSLQKSRPHLHQKRRQGFPALHCDWHITLW